MIAERRKGKIKYLLLIITLLIHNVSLAHEQVTNLITPVTYFVDHISQLALLKSNLNKYWQASIVGVSGMGKTQLARLYAHKNRDHYNLIWFLDCNLDLNEEFLKLAKSINRINKANIISEDAMSAKKEIMEYLSHKEKWLLVFDNLKINNNKRVEDVIHWEHNGNVIFCSQDSEMLPNVVEVSAFNIKDATILANNLLENRSSKSADLLAEEWNGYPVLIVQGVQLLNKVKGLRTDEYKDKIKQSTDKIRLNIVLAINELKPSAVELLSKIAVINNQKFSRELLSFIINDPSTLDDDIYQLSKFTLISNTDPRESNPIFEMHDVVAEKILEINGIKNNKQYLEDITDRIIKSMPKNVVQGHNFRHADTVRENLEIILKNAQRYNADIYKTMILNVSLFTDYINNFDYYNGEKILNWFNKNDQEGRFKLWMMQNKEKCAYAQYAAIIGAYYKRRCADDMMSLKYLTKAKEVIDNVKDYDAIKCNIYYNVALTNLALGRPLEAKMNIQAIIKILNDGLADDIIFVYLAKTRLFLTEGKYQEALEQANKAIETFGKNGVHPDDLLLTNIYMLRAEALNILGQYSEAYKQSKQLFRMHQTSKKLEHEVFGRIYTIMARAELEEGKIKQAFEHISKAIKIFLADEYRNPKNADFSHDLDLATSYVVQGNILFAQDNLKTALESYRAAQGIYFNVYKENSRNIDHVSYLYLHGAKAACKKKDTFYYECFGKPQIEEFGVRHRNTVEMLKYCKQANVDLPDDKGD